MEAVVEEIAAAFCELQIFKKLFIIMS